MVGFHFFLIFSISLSLWKNRTMHKEETLSYYEQKVYDVVNYIHANPGGELNIRTLSDKFNISYFHFHRILRAALDEPLGIYVNRIRLNNSAKMIRETTDSISEIAEKTGYNNLSAFSKEFGISPQEYRLEDESSMNNEIDFQFLQNRVIDRKIDPKIKVFPACKVIYIKLKGEYGGKCAYEAWETILNFAVKKRIISWNPDYFSIYYDDPDVVGVDNCDFDCCLNVKKEVELEGSIELKDFDGGKYLVFRYKGPWDNLWEVYNMLYRDYIILLDKYQLRDAPVIEKYLKYSEKMKPDNYVTLKIPGSFFIDQPN
jgi:AraC family transcriptional regulator